MKLRVLTTVSCAFALLFIYSGTGLQAQSGDESAQTENAAREALTGFFEAFYRVHVRDGGA